MGTRGTFLHPRTGREGPEGENRYISALYLTLALGGVGGQRHAQAASPPAKETRYPLYRGWAGPTAGLDGYGKYCLHRD
jgi:hypothetical protein